MYDSFRSVTVKNSKILTPTRTGDFLLTFLRDGLAHQFSLEVESLENSRQRMVNVITYSRWS